MEVAKIMYYLSATQIFPKEDMNGFRKPPAIIRITRKSDDLQKEAKLEVIKNPKYAFYIRKNIDNGKYEGFHPIEGLHRIECPYMQRRSRAAKELGFGEEYRNVQERAKMLHDREIVGDFTNKFIKNNPNVFRFDVPLLSYDKTQYYIDKIADNPSLNEEKKDMIPVCVPRMAKMDIETRTPSNADRDVLHVGGRYPVSLIVHHNIWEKKAYVYMLVDEYNHNGVRAAIDGADINGHNLERIFLKNARKYDDFRIVDKDIKFVFLLFENELKMLKAYWNMIHATKPEFCGIWNMLYDINTILYRIERLGGNANEICCHPEVPEEYRICEYIPDRERINAYVYGTKNVYVTEDDELILPEKEKKVQKGDFRYALLWDKFNLPGYTQFYDQMSLYANLRKQQRFNGYSLDTVGERELKFGKVSLKNHGCTITNVEKKNYPLFLRYGIVDTILLSCLEDIHKDVYAALTLCELTPFLNVTSVMRILYDQVSYVLYRHAYIIANCPTYEDLYEKYPDICEGFRGGIVADIAQMVHKPSIVSGSRTNIFRWVIDLDYSQMYPSTIAAFNISKETMIGRFINIDNSDISDCLMDSLLALDTSIFELATEIGLPNIDQLIVKISKDFLEGK